MQLEVVFFDISLQGGLNDFSQVRGLLPDSGETVFFCIVGLQKPGYGIVGNTVISLTVVARRVPPVSAGRVHGQGQGAEFHGFLAGVGDIGSKTFFLNGLYHGGEGLIQVLIIRLGQSSGRAFSVDSGFMAELLCQDGRNAGKASVNRFEEGLWLRT